VLAVLRVFLHVNEIFYSSAKGGCAEFSRGVFGFLPAILDAAEI